MKIVFNSHSLVYEQNLKEPESLEEAIAIIEHLNETIKHKDERIMALKNLESALHS